MYTGTDDDVSKDVESPDPAGEESKTWHTITTYIGYVSSS